MNIIENVKSYIGSNAANIIAEKLGITSEQASSALDAGIPATLAGLLKNSDAVPGGTSLTNLFDGAKVESTTLEQAELSGESDWLEKGKSLIGNVFGSNTDGIANALAGHAGVGAEKSHGLLAMILPFVTGAISKLTTANGWNISDFVSKLWEDKSSIAAALPAGLKSTIGVDSLLGADFSETKTPVVEMPRVDIKTPPVHHVESHAKVEKPVTSYQQETKSSSFWTWLIPLLLVALALWYFLGRNNSEKMAVVGDSTMNAIDTTMVAVKGTLNEAGDYIANLGDSVTKVFPNGKEIVVGANSVENKLISFIEDEGKDVDKETWFTFDRLFFETGKSTLKPESKTQVAHIAAILKAYPTVELKLGGYTDNTGDAEVNKKISEERAKVALQALVALGINADRLEAEGYGAEHPVASNDTAEGRAQNRRIDVRVTKK